MSRSSTITIPELSSRQFSTNYTPPEVKIAGCYSIDHERNFIDGPKFMKFCENFNGTKTVHYDLNVGFNMEATVNHDKEFMPKRREENSSLIHLLKWIQLHKTEFEERRPHFVVLRGLLKRILTTPYDDPKKRNWIFGAMRKNGTIYIRNLLDESTEDHEKEEKSEFWWKTMGWGRTFEDVLLTDEPKQRESSSKSKPKYAKSTTPLGSECRAILRTKIGEHDILCSAELDGVSAKYGMDLEKVNPKENLKNLSKCKMIEVKTSRVFYRGKLADRDFKKDGSRRWWIQSVLGGVSNVLVGYRNNQGIVNEIENIPIDDLHRKYAVGWYAEAGFKFLDLFLTQVKNTVQDDSVVYVFSYKKDSEKDVDLKRGFGTQVKLVVEENSDNLLTDLI